MIIILPSCRQDSYWRLSEARELIFQYASQHDLVSEKDQRMVRMDEFLAINIMGKKTLCGEFVQKKTLAEKCVVGDAILLPSCFLCSRFTLCFSLCSFAGKLKTFTFVTRDGVGGVSKGPIAPILVQTEQRQGRKVVTIISGFETFMVSPDVLRQVCLSCRPVAHMLTSPPQQQELAKKFAASTTLGEMEGKKNENKKEVLVQGEVTKGVTEFLLQNYQVPKKYIQVVNKVAKKKGRGGK